MLLQLLLSPWAESAGIPGRITGLFGAGAVLAALYAISENRKIWIAGVILAVPAFLHRVTVWPNLQSLTSRAGLSSSILFDVFITTIILEMRKDGAPSVVVVTGRHGRRLGHPATRRIPVP